MRIRRLIAALLMAAVLGMGIHSPRPARADDTALIVVGSIAVYFGVIFGATWYLRNRGSGFSESSVSPFLPGGQLPSTAAPSRPGSVRVGPDCAALKQGLSVVCW